MTETTYNIICSGSTKHSRVNQTVEQVQAWLTQFVSASDHKLEFAIRRKAAQDVREWLAKDPRPEQYRIGGYSIRAVDQTLATEDGEPVEQLREGQAFIHNKQLFRSNGTTPGYKYVKCVRYADLGPDGIFWMDVSKAAKLLTLAHGTIVKRVTGVQT